MTSALAACDKEPANTSGSNGVQTNDSRNGVKTHTNESRPGTVTHPNDSRNGVKVHSNESRPGVHTHPNECRLEVKTHPNESRLEVKTQPNDSRPGVRTHQNDSRPGVLSSNCTSEANSLPALCDLSVSSAERYAVSYRNTSGSRESLAGRTATSDKPRQRVRYATPIITTNSGRDDSFYNIPPPNYSFRPGVSSEKLV